MFLFFWGVLGGGSESGISEGGRSKGPRWEGGRSMGCGVKRIEGMRRKWMGGDGR